MSYHNHTRWSDAESTVPEMIAGARRAGLSELGISDHFVVAPSARPCSWSMQTESLADYVAEIRKAQAACENYIKIRLGLEVDFFPETIASVRKILSGYPFDYLIGSVHFVGDFSIDSDPAMWAELSEDSINQIWRGYWQRVRAAAQSGCFDIIGHFDLPKKFNFYPLDDLTEDALAALDAIAAAGMALEINTSGWHKPACEAYPSLFYLQQAKRRDIPILISADAHNAADLARDFDRARTLAIQAGYAEVACFEQRRRSFKMI